MYVKVRLLLISALLLVLWNTKPVLGECAKGGALDVYVDWYDRLLSHEFAPNSLVIFRYNVTFRQKDNEQRPLSIVLHTNDQWLDKATCQEKVDKASTGFPYSEVITLNTTNQWSGCQLYGDKLACAGSIDFDSKANKSTNYTVAVARCGSSFNINIAYRVEFASDSGICQSSTVTTPSTETTTIKTPMQTASPQLTAVTIIASINSTIIFGALLYLLIKKFKLCARLSNIQAPIRLQAMIYDNDEF